MKALITARTENSLDYRRFLDIQLSKAEIRAMLNIPQYAYVIGHVRRFCESKNHTFLVSIFQELVQMKENAFLLLVGSGEMKREIIQSLSSLGLVGKTLILSHRPDIPVLMKAMDVFVFPSIYEGFGIVAVEAQASGLKCVMANTLPKDIFITKNAIPMPLKNPTDWARVILDTSIESKNSVSYLSDWDMNNEIKKLEKLYLGEKL